MKSIFTLAAAMFLLICLAATPVMAASATAAVDINSAYVWRGITFNDGLVIQPSIDVAADNGLGINVWGNYDIDDYDNTLDDKEFSEILLIPLLIKSMISSLTCRLAISSKPSKTNRIGLNLQTEIRSFELKFSSLE